MPNGPREDSGSQQQHLELLSRQAVTGSDGERIAAREALALLLPTLDEVVALLRQERGAEKEDVFLVSLKHDAGRRAVSQAAAEIVPDQATCDGSENHSRMTSGADFLRRVDEFALGLCDASGQRTGGSVLRLYDSGHYRRSRRSKIENEIIALVDEGLERQDDEFRTRVFERLWQWAYRLIWAKCHDRDVAHDLATDAIIRLLSSAEADAVRPGQITPGAPPIQEDAHSAMISGVEVVRRVYSTLGVSS